MTAVLKGRNNGLEYSLDISQTSSGFEVTTSHLGDRVGEYSFISRGDLVANLDKPSSPFRELMPFGEFIWSGWLFVLESHRGQGICPALVDEGIKELGKLGGLHVVSFSDSVAKTSRNTFLRRGYKPLDGDPLSPYTCFYRKF